MQQDFGRCQLLGPAGAFHFRCSERCTFTSAADFASSRRELGDEDVALPVVDREEESPRTDGEVRAIRLTREVIEPDEYGGTLTR
jgi:hypothetical protein